MYTLFGEFVADPELELDEKSSNVVTVKSGYGGVMTDRDKQLFAFADTIFASDRKSAWLAYQKLLTDGFGVEADIHSKVWWVIKSVQAVRSGNVSDIKPFTLKKAQITNTKWSGELLHSRTIEFLESIIETRTLGTPSQYTLEKWILTLP